MKNIWDQTVKLIKMNEQDVKNQFKKQPFSSFPVSHYFMHFFTTQMQSLKLGPLFLTDIFTGKAAHGVNKHQLISLFFVCFLLNSETRVQSQASWDNLFILWDK